MTMTRKIFLSSLLAMVGTVWVGSAQAVPSFARKYEKKCSACHYAFPQLNKAGRMFKEAGYRFPSDAKVAQKISDFLYWDKTPPVSVVFVARPYDKKDSGDSKIRAVHEVELFFAGVIGKQWSGWAEFEAEDENDFKPELGSATVGYHPSKALNVQLTYGPYMWADPYGFLGNHFRMTRGSVGVIDQAFGGADGGGKLRSARQMVSIYGRPTDKFFYNVGYSGVAGDVEGESPNNFHGRLALDVTRNVMIGGFGLSGQEETSKRDFSRVGLDFSADVGDARIQGAYVSAKDDRVGGVGQDENKAWSLQAMYAFRNDKRPTWVPVVRLDSYEKSNGTESYTALTLNLTHYFTENIKGYIEYWDQLDVPAGKKADSRITVQAVAAF
ncbi:MAG TPA: hypothetical protein ENI80_09035 [Acidiferrobacteraceae bacterium]|nr:hypothetical protein [Acidiferrobacteraceae bacterium]